MFLFSVSLVCILITCPSLEGTPLNIMDKIKSAVANRFHSHSTPFQMETTTTGEFNQATTEEHEHTVWEKSFISKDPGDIHFYLYGNNSSNNVESFVELDVDTLENFKGSLNMTAPLVILIHGFQQTFQSRFPQEAKNAYLQSGHSNVICVDWGALAKPKKRVAPFLYPMIADNVPVVAKKVATLIISLKHEGIVANLSQVHIVGFSLGAHVAGVAGHLIATSSNDLIGRITGLDPAGPKFITYNLDRRLDPADASFVDVIHTNEGQLGHLGRLGHVDFYPNGGHTQPHCLDTSDGDHFFASLNKVISGICSHTRATIYFTNSILRNPSQSACMCDSWSSFKKSCSASCPDPVTFGENCPATARGKYYLYITDQQ